MTQPDEEKGAKKTNSTRVLGTEAAKNKEKERKNIKRLTSYDGTIRVSNKLKTAISDHVFRKPLKEFAMKIHEKEVYN